MISTATSSAEKPPDGIKSGRRVGVRPALTETSLSRTRVQANSYQNNKHFILSPLEGGIVLGFPVTARVSLEALFFFWVKTPRAVNLLFFGQMPTRPDRRKEELDCARNLILVSLHFLVSSIQSLQTRKLETGAGKMLDGQRFFPVLRVQSRAGSHGFLSSLRLLVPQNRGILEKKNGTEKSFQGS